MIVKAVLEAVPADASPVNVSELAATTATSKRANLIPSELLPGAHEQLKHLAGTAINLRSAVPLVRRERLGAEEGRSGSRSSVRGVVGGSEDADSLLRFH